MLCLCFFFFKQKTAYEMRISDWSSDVCSSDLDRLPRSHSKDWQISDTVLERGASVGANATIVCGVRLGRHCMVAAGAVVTADVPPFALVMGCPATIVDYVTVSGRRLHRKPSDGPPTANEVMDKQRLLRADAL